MTVSPRQRELAGGPASATDSESATAASSPARCGRRARATDGRTTPVSRTGPEDESAARSPPRFVSLTRPSGEGRGPSGVTGMPVQFQLECHVIVMIKFKLGRGCHRDGDGPEPAARRGRTRSFGVVYYQRPLSKRVVTATARSPPPGAAVLGALGSSITSGRSRSGAWRRSAGGPGQSESLRSPITESESRQPESPSDGPSLPVPGRGNLKPSSDPESEFRGSVTA